ncbi:MAG: 50S ribosomal protein L15 [Chloroflexi bacterium]|nr:50S ribosomal protein L15 [Chloroflexota bacterium]
MKLHDLRPADGSRQPRTRVGRGIAAGKGKTAGRGTKGQKARAGGSIPPWFEGGQTPLHMRIPKLRGFKNRFKIEYEVVNVGAIGALAERGAFETDASAKQGSKAAPITVNQDILRAVGLVRTLNKPLKILGAGELTAPLFVVADAFTASARAKIEAAGGSVNVLEIPTESRPALGVDGETVRTAREPRTAAGRAAVDKRADAREARTADAAEAAAVVAEAEAAKAAKAAKPAKPAKVKAAPAVEAAAPAEVAATTGAAETVEVPEVTEATTSPDASEAAAETDAPGADA